MNAALIVVVALGGGAGAAGRFLLDGLINTGREFRLPVGTLTINGGSMRTTLSLIHI